MPDKSPAPEKKLLDLKPARPTPDEANEVKGGGAPRKGGFDDTEEATGIGR